MTLTIRCRKRHTISRQMRMARCACGLMLAMSAIAASAGGTSARKKYISFGWEYKCLTPQAILANADKFAATGIDGIGMYLCATNSEGKELKFISKGDKWEREAFLPQIPLLRKIMNTPHLSESFCVGYGSPVKRFSWTDDAAWENLANSMSVLGWITRETGIKGISCDLEDYHHQWQYNRLDTDPPYDELLPIVRKRGAQVFGALFKENPNIKALFYWILCFETEYLTSPDPVALARQNGDLSPAFFDGILDVMPETARLINGDEHTYRAEAVKRDFHNSYVNQRTICPRLVSPENRAKFMRLVQASFAIYYDMYANDEKSFWYFPPIDGSRAEHLRRNLLDATRLADEYVWFWGEKHPTIHWENAHIEARVRCPDTWEEAIPGITDAMLCCKDPDWGLARRIATLRREGKLADRNPNPECRPGGKKDGLPPPYYFWKAKSDKTGRIFLDTTIGHGDTTSIAVKDCANACALYTLKGAEPGEAYGVEMAVRGRAVVHISFQKNGDWVRGMQGVSLVQGEPDADGWRTARSMVVMPPGTDSFVVKMSADKLNGTSSAWFDDIHVYKLW